MDHQTRERLFDLMAMEKLLGAITDPATQVYVCIHHLHTAKEAARLTDDTSSPTQEG